MPNQPMSAFQQKVLAALTSDFEAEYYIRIKVYPVRKLCASNRRSPAQPIMLTFSRR